MTQKEKQNSGDSINVLTSLYSSLGPETMQLQPLLSHPEQPIVQMQELQTHVICSLVSTET